MNKRTWHILATGVCVALGGSALAAGMFTPLGGTSPWGRPLVECHSPAPEVSGEPSRPLPKAEPVASHARADSSLSIPAWPATLHVGTFNERGEIERCQYQTGDAACAGGCATGGLPDGWLNGVECRDGRCGILGAGEAHWNAWRPIPWQQLAQGEYVGPARLAHVPEYRLRVDDSLDFIYRLTREESSKPYEMNVGDTIKLESLTDSNLDRELVIQPDGTITVRLLGQVRAARRTVESLRTDLEEQYKKYYKVPAITITPIKVNTKLEDLRATVDSRGGTGGQVRQARITPEGTLALPAIGSVPAQGLTLDELKAEVDERYRQVVDGIEVTPVLIQRAARYVYVLGEVRTPGRFTLEAPTTAMQSIAMAGGWVNTGNLREIVVFRRTDDWRLMATRLDLRGAMLGKRPCPADEIWLRDCDLVIVPKHPIALANDFIELVFTKGLYGVLPGYQLARAGTSTLTTLP